MKCKLTGKVRLWAALNQSRWLDCKPWPMGRRVQLRTFDDGTHAFLLEEGQNTDGCLKCSARKLGWRFQK